MGRTIKRAKKAKSKKAKKVPYLIDSDRIISDCCGFIFLLNLSSVYFASLD
jgi:hypothetical protein